MGQTVALNRDRCIRHPFATRRVDNGAIRQKSASPFTSGDTGSGQPPGLPPAGRSYHIIG